MSRAVLVPLAAGVLVASGAFAPAAAQYPTTMVATAEVKGPASTTTATITIKVDRLMREADYKRALDALTHGGFANFYPVFSRLPVVGSVALNTRSVDLRYAREETRESGRRLVLAGDKPLYYLAGGATEPKPRTGYEMTLIELTLDEQGAGTGTMAAAARVRPAPGGAGVVVDDYAEMPIQLSVRRQ
jgi:hypothetical protein